MRRAGWLGAGDLTSRPAAQNGGTETGTQPATLYTEAMSTIPGFDAERARHVATTDDRDEAPFFAGRAAEIRHFDEAIAQARQRGPHNTRSLVRIFQGAPGCGKTSLVTHLQQIRNDLLFVAVEPEDFANREAITTRVLQQVARQASAADKALSWGLGAVTAMVRAGEAGEELRKALAGRDARKTMIVPHMDEAQRIWPSADGVVSLHTRGMEGGVPTVCVFTGLSHTAERIRAIEGMSRLADEAIVNMGRMSDGECAASTMAMLAAVGALGDHETTATRAAALAHGWPQHLTGVHKALCRELIRTDGRLDQVDDERVSRDSTARRHAYYRQRLEGTVLGDDTAFTARVVGAIRRRGPMNRRALIRLCAKQISAAGFNDDVDTRVTGEGFGRALVEKGVLAETPSGGRYEVATPSMADWLQDRLAGP